MYATLFPNRLNRLVLDSNVNPQEVWYESVFSQDLAFESNARKWFRWLARYNKTYRLGATAAAVENKFYTTLNSLPVNPPPGRIGQNEWINAFLTGLYSPDSWDSFGSMWTSWLRDHDPRGIINILALEPENTRAANLAVTCTDAGWPPMSTWIEDTRETYRKAKFVTWANTWESAPCAYWPAEGRQTPVPIDGSRVSNALLVDQTHDGPTPYRGSLVLRRLFPNASLVSVPGGTAHATSLMGPPCVGRHVTAYLRDGTLPDRQPGTRADAHCAPAAAPKPGG